MDTTPITEITRNLIKAFFPGDKKLLDWFEFNSLEGLPLHKIKTDGYPQTDKLIDVFVRGGATEVLDGSIAHRKYHHSVSDIPEAIGMDSRTGNYTKTIFYDEFLGKVTSTHVFNDADSLTGISPSGKDDYCVDTDYGYDEQGELIGKQITRKEGDFVDHLTEGHHKGELSHISIIKPDGTVREIHNVLRNHDGSFIMEFSGHPSDTESHLTVQKEEDPKIETTTLLIPTTIRKVVKEYNDKGYVTTGYNSDGEVFKKKTVVMKDEVNVGAIITSDKTYEDLLLGDYGEEDILYVYNIDESVYEVFNKHGECICSIDKTGWGE